MFGTARGQIVLTNHVHRPLIRIYKED